jgi:hypothetical protein
VTDEKVSVSLSRSLWSELIDALKFQGEFLADISADEVEYEDWAKAEMDAINLALKAIFDALGLPDCPHFEPPPPEPSCAFCINKSCNAYARASQEERESKYSKWACTKQHFKECQEGNYKHFIFKRPN